MKFSSWWRLAWLLPLLWLSGCGAGLDDYRGSRPGWDLARFFNGKLVAHGLVTDRSGEVTSRFRVEMQGHWREGKGELFEQFYFDDGRRQTRTWFLSKGADGHWRGTASDVVRVSFDDWMYLLDDDRLINRAKISKFGIHLGEVILYIERLEQ